MAFIEISFDAKNIVVAAKMQQQFVSQMQPLGYEFSKVEFQPVSKSRIQAKITLTYQNKNKRNKQTT